MARFRRRRPPVIIASHSRQARRISCRANQARCGAGHAAAARVSTSAMNMSSRLVSFLPFCWRNSASVPSATRRPDGDDADAVGHALGDFEDVRRHDHGARRTGRAPAAILDLARGQRVEPGERLVQDDQARIMHQRAGQRHLLPHALGKSLAALVRDAAPARARPAARARGRSESLGSMPHRPATNSRYSSGVSLS